MTDPLQTRRRIGPLAIFCLVVEAVLLVLFIPGLAYVEVLQHDGAGGWANALGFAIMLLVIAVILVVASIIGFVRDRRSGFPLGLSIAAIAIGVVLAIAHVGLTLPGALT